MKYRRFDGSYAHDRLLTLSEVKDYLREVIIPHDFYYVYVFHNEKHEPVYVGKGHRSRVLQHFYSKYLRTSLHQFLMKHKFFISFYYVTSYAYDALMHESALIETYSNLFNKVKGTTFIIDKGTYRIKNSTQRRKAKLIFSKLSSGEKIGLALKGRTLSDYTKQRMSASRTGMELTETWKRNISLGRLNSDKVKQQSLNRGYPVKVLGKFYPTMAEASEDTNIAVSTLRYRLMNKHEGYRFL